MKTEWIFPIILMTLDVGAGIVYLLHKDIRMFLYWFFAQQLTATVTFK